MAEPKLKISPDLALPIDAVTGTFGILATKGAGKSNAAVVMAEEMWDAGVPWVAVDPKGDWWGVRSSADGTGAGLPIVVFGGRHGDVPLEPTAGAVIAELVLEQRLTCVLDVSQFSKADVTRFLTAFGDYLFRHADDESAEPLHVFMEEAHEYLPQVVRTDKGSRGPSVPEMVSIWQRIVKQGRFKGIGCTLISQRSSALNKDVLELVDTLVVLRTIGPLSRKSIEGWVKDQDVDAALLASLPTLGNGEAWLWSPGELKIMKRIQWRQRRTFDSGSTPKVGQARRAPATLADVDLAAVKEAMASTIEKAMADDPKELHKRIATLERQLAEARKVAITPEPIIERVEVRVPLITDEMRSEFGVLLEATREARPVMEQIWVLLNDKTASVIDKPAPPAGRPGVDARKRASTPATAPRAPKPETPVSGSRDPGAGTVDAPTESERAILTALAQYPEGRTGRQLTVLTGKRWSGGFRNYLSKFRTNGWMIGGNSQVMRITEDGLAALGDWDPLPAGAALLDFWLDELTEAEGNVLAAIAAHYPDPVDGRDIAAGLGKEWSGGFRNYLSKLRTLELIDGRNDAMVLSEELVG